MEDNDGALVVRFVRSGDGRAFSIIVNRYTDMVYSTCRRILGNDTQAADAAQETFFDLLKNADRITGSLGSWLHRVATRRAVDFVRRDTARRRREASYSADSVCRGDSWAEVEPLVDQAMEELSAEASEFLRLHYLEGKRMTQIAATKGLSQPTVSRRTAEALEQLREKLREKGAVVAVWPLQTLLLHSGCIAPEAVRHGLRKIVLAQAVSSKPGEAKSIAALLKSSAVKITLTGAGLGSIAGIVWLLASKEGFRFPPPSTLTMQPTQPAAQLVASQTSFPANPEPFQIITKPPTAPPPAAQHVVVASRIPVTASPEKAPIATVSNVGPAKASVAAEPPQPAAVPYSIAYSPQLRFANPQMRRPQVGPQFIPEAAAPLAAQTPPAAPSAYNLGANLGMRPTAPAISTNRNPPLVRTFNEQVLGGIVLDLFRSHHPLPLLEDNLSSHQFEDQRSPTHLKATESQHLDGKTAQTL